MDERARQGPHIHAYTTRTVPSDSSMMSSKRLYVSGVGCSRATSTVALRMWENSRSVRVIWKVVLLSRPVEISSRNSVFLGPTIISPAHMAELLLLDACAMQTISKLTAKHSKHAAHSQQKGHNTCNTKQLSYSCCPVWGVKLTQHILPGHALEMRQCSAVQLSDDAMQSEVVQ